MKPTENISSISIANGTKAPVETTVSKRQSVVEDLGIGEPSEANSRAAAENARNEAKELKAENNTLSSGVKTLVNVAAKLANKILKLEDEVKSGDLEKADTVKYEKEIRELQKEQKECQSEIKDSQKQIAVNNQAAQEAEKKAEDEDKKAEEAKKEAEIKAQAEKEEATEAVTAKENDTAEADTKSDAEATVEADAAQNAADAKETEETIEAGEAENLQEETAEENQETVLDTKEDIPILDETGISNPEEIGIVVENTGIPEIAEAEEEKTTPATEIENIIQEIVYEEADSYLDTAIETTPGTSDTNINADDLAQKIQTDEIVEAVQTYEEIGVAVDAETLVKASVTELDAIVETAIVQEVLKTATTGKKMGAIANITSKKEMQQNKEAADDFQANFITLQSYYNTNDIYNVAAEGFITLASEMYTNIAQGATYDTLKLNEASSTAVNLTATIQSDVANSTLTIKDTDGQYEETKMQAQNALDKAKDAVGEDKENTSLNDLETEFLTVTTNYRNATADSEKQETITNLLKIITRANTVENDPESKISTDERLMVTL